MRKLYAVLALFLLAAVSYAQQVVTINNGVATLDVERFSKFKVVLNQNITSVAITPSVGVPNGTTVSVLFIENSSGGFTVTFGGNTSGTCTVNATSNQGTACQLQFDSASNTWFILSGGGGNPDPPISQNYSLTTTGAQTAINLTAAPIDTHTISWRLGTNSLITDAMPYSNGTDLHTDNANWVYDVGTFNVSTANLSIAAAYGSAASSFAHRSDGPNTTNEWAQETVVETTTSGTQNNGPCVRMQNGAATAYCAQIATDPLFRIIWYNAGSANVLGTFNSSAPVSGDVVRIEAIGTTINLYKNGVLVGSATDSNLTSGFTGMTSTGNSNSNGASNFQSAPTCTIALDTSPDGTTWTAGGAITNQNCSAPGSYTVSVTANFVRVNLVAIAPSQTLNVVYSGRLAPASSGVGTASVNNGQYVTAGEIMWTQLTSQNIGTIGYTSVAKINQTNGVLAVTNYTVSACGMTGGGFGSGFVIPVSGWLQSTYTQINTPNLPQGAIYAQHYILESMPTGGNTAGCVSTLATRNFGTMLDGNPTGSFYTTGFTGTTVWFTSPWSIPGFTTTITTGNPAAGAEFSITIPESAGNASRTCVQSLSYTLAAGSTNVTPAVLLTLNGSKLYYSATTAQTSASTQIYSFSPGSAEIVTGQASPNTIHIVPFNNGQAVCFNSGLSTATISSVTNGLNGTTQYSNVSVLVQLQQDNN